MIEYRTRSDDDDDDDDDDNGEEERSESLALGVRGEEDWRLP